MKWKPSKKQKMDFAIKMQDPDFKDQYLARKRQTPFVPSREQYMIACELAKKDVSESVTFACAMVIEGYISKSKTDHKHIHIINEFRRGNSI